MVNNNTHRPPQQHQIQPYIPVMHVPTVHLDSFGVVDVAAAAGLPHACNAREDGVVFFDVLAVPGNFRLHDGPRSYKAHFSFQHVPELGEFVEAGFPEEGAALCDAGVVFQLEFLIPFRLRLRVRGQKVVQDFFRVHTHGAEFVAVEFFPVFPHSPVFENHRTRGVVVHPDGDGEKEGRNEDASYDGGTDVEEPLQEPVPRVVQVIPDVEHHDLRVEEGFHGHVGHGDRHQVRYHRHVLHQGLGPVDEVRQPVLGQPGGGDEDRGDSRFLYCFLQVIESPEDGHPGAVVFVGFPVFQKSQDPVPHARVFPDLLHHEVCRAPSADDEDGDLEGGNLLEGLAHEDPDNGEAGEGEHRKEQHKEPGHLSRHLGDKHEEHGKHGASDAGEEDPLRHLVHQHPFPVEPFEEHKEHKYQGQPEEEVRRRQVEGAVGHDVVPDPHRQEARHHQCQVVKKRKNNSR